MAGTFSFATRRGICGKQIWLYCMFFGYKLSWVFLLQYVILSLFPSLQTIIEMIGDRISLYAFAGKKFCRESRILRSQQCHRIIGNCVLLLYFYLHNYLKLSQT